jgi:lysophospholipase L1-like esterase
MQLNFDQICAVTHGAAEIRQEEGGIRFYRLTDAQFAAFYAENPSIGNTCAGIKLVFRTNSRRLGLKALLDDALYWWPLVSFDIQVNGETIGYLDNFSHIENFVPKFDEQLPLGPVEKQFDLGEGEKVVTVHLPWCHRFLLQQVTLDDDAFAAPVQKKKLLMYGDSITQGYCATRPSRRLAALAAAGLDMEECNRTMAGSTFLPDVAAAMDPVRPDAITVTYGSNDWGKGKTAEKLHDDCRRFLQALQKNNPGVPIAVVSPIWRSSFACCNPCIDYETVTETLRQAAAEFDNLHFICGVDLVPHEEAMFFDGLHPNDEGMAIYAEHLIAQLKAYLKP